MHIEGQKEKRAVESDYNATVETWELLRYGRYTLSLKKNIMEKIDSLKIIRKNSSEL